MKTSAKKFASFGNTGIVQVMAEPFSTIAFRPGGPEMKSGGLEITEYSESGIVGKLVAINRTQWYLLLTDADVLTGARQNRIINKSVLLAPASKTILDVSCIERLRWSYSSKNFSSPDSTADHNLRKAKAASMSFGQENPQNNAGNIQHNVWSHIRNSMMEEKITERTESYHEIAKMQFSRSAQTFPECDPEEGCNGIGVVVGGRMQCIDLFGSEDVYRFYFPLLRDSAFRMARQGKGIKKAELHESFFRVLDALDSFDNLELKKDESYMAAGMRGAGEAENLAGFRLNIEGQVIHQAVFGK